MDENKFQRLNIISCPCILFLQDSFRVKPFQRPKRDREVTLMGFYELQLYRMFTKKQPFTGFLCGSTFYSSSISGPPQIFYRERVLKEKLKSKSLHSKKYILQTSDADYSSVCVLSVFYGEEFFHSTSMDRWPNKVIL